jgi:hypothetical protein
VTVKAVVGDVQFAADEPLRERLVPFEHRVPLPEPVKIFSLPRPEGFGIRGGFGVEFFLIFETLYLRLFGEVFRWVEHSRFLKNRLDRVRVRHAVSIRRGPKKLNCYRR